MQRTFALDAFIIQKNTACCLRMFCTFRIFINFWSLWFYIYPFQNSGQSIILQVSNLRILCPSVCLSRKIWKRLFMVTPCTRPWHTLYQTLTYLTPNSVPPCTRLFHPLYQTLPVHREQGAGRSEARPPASFDRGNRTIRK